MFSRAPLVLLVVLPSVVAQRRVWVVGAGGQFTDIPPAIAAASPGDRIEVSMGTYSAFTVSTGIDVEAAAGVVVPQIVVRDLPAGNVVQVAGFQVAEPMTTFLGNVAVLSCAGTVVLTGLTVQPKVLSLVAPTVGIYVDACAGVSVTDCTVLPVPSCGGLWVRNSTVTMRRCTLEGGQGHTVQGNHNCSLPGGSGIWATNSTVVIAETTLRAGRGGDGVGGMLLMCPCAANGGVALAGDANSNVLMLTGSATGGPPGSNNPSGCPSPTQGSAIQGPVKFTAQCTLSGGVTGGATQVAPLPGIAAPSQLVLGIPTTLTLGGAQVFLLLFSDQLGGASFPSLNMPLLLSPTNFNIGPVVAAGPYTFTIPLDPNWRNRFVFFQGLAVFPTPEFTTLSGLRMR